MLPQENNIKLIAVDLDNTIVKDGVKQISPRLKEDLFKAKEKGIHVMLNTGRHYTFIYSSMFEDIPMDYIGTINGACLVKKDGSVIETHPMDEGLMNEIIAFGDQYDLAIGFKFVDAVVTYHNNELFRKYYIAEGKEMEDRIINNDAGRDHHLEFGLPLGTFIIGDGEVIDQHLNDFKDVTITYARPYSYDLFLNHINKTLTVDRVLRELGLSWSQVIAFGDAGNDISVIQKAGIGVMMANAAKDIQQYADIVAPACDEDGVAVVLEELKIV